MRTRLGCTGRTQKYYLPSTGYACVSEELSGSKIKGEWFKHLQYPV